MAGASRDVDGAAEGLLRIGGEAMREASLSATLKSNMKRLGVRYVRVEDAAGIGTPDVYLRCGPRSAWIELKHVAACPKRPTTPLRIDHFTDEQRLWLRAEGLAGGLAWLFMQVADDYLLFKWDAAQDVGMLTKGQMFERAAWAGRKPCDWGGFVSTALKIIQI
jgi:hypothetical protein